MKRCQALLAVLSAGLLAAGCRGPATSADWPDPDRLVQVELRASTDIGEARHKEKSNLTDLKSDWNALLVRPRLVADLRTRWGLEASGELNWFWTNNEEESWDVGGTALEDNELDIGGWEFRALAGWGLTAGRWGHYSLLGGLSGRFIELDRKFDDGTRAKTESDIYLVEVEARARVPVRSEDLKVPVSLELSASYGWVLDPEAKVKGAGTIEGDRGWMARLRAGLEVGLNERTSLYLGGFLETLEIEGGTDGAFEWADSETPAGGAELGLRVRF